METALFKSFTRSTGPNAGRNRTQSSGASRNLRRFALLKPDHHSSSLPVFPVPGRETVFPGIGIPIRSTGNSIASVVPRNKAEPRANRPQGCTEFQEALKPNDLRENNSLSFLLQLMMQTRSSQGPTPSAAAECQRPGLGQSSWSSYQPARLELRIFQQPTASPCITARRAAGVSSTRGPLTQRLCWQSFNRTD